MLRIKEQETRLILHEHDDDDDDDDDDDEYNRTLELWHFGFDTKLCKAVQLFAIKPSQINPLLVRSGKPLSHVEELIL